jgi:glycosyltransferase involved in cell wall biosynthesis
MARAKVSVVTTAYNSEEYIDRALRSIKNQTFSHSNIEHIVVDDASIDRTKDIVRSFDEPYLRLIEKTENSGGTKALNRGIQEANGEYIVVLDSDDEFEPTLVEEMWGVLQDCQNISFVYSDYYEETLDGERVYIDTGEDIFNTVTIGVMHQAETIEQFGRYNPSMHFSEYDLLLQYLNSGIRGYHIPKPLFIYHRREDSQTSDSEWVHDGEYELKRKYGDHVNIRGYEL